MDPMPYHFSVVMVWCFHIEHDLQSNHTLELSHALPYKAIPSLKWIGWAKCWKHKFRSAEQTVQHFVLSFLMREVNWSTAKTLKAFKKTLLCGLFSKSSKILPFKQQIQMWQYKNKLPSGTDRYSILSF